ncbi:30S ribosomal protein S14 [bacterium]|jgi:small subunit ribosomal protein S14|nr:30S ribosomal protein S14 [bacterium]MBT5015202.1 30S ribosomal protein S14 [bacterium]
MAKKSKIERNKQRIELVKQYADVRKELVDVVKDQHASIEDKIMAQEKLSKLPRNSSKVRVRNRCALTGRPRGYMGFFKISRIELRRLALSGELPGVKKASW